MQYKNNYYFTGAIDYIYPLVESEYKGKKQIEREVIVVNKFQRRGRWIVSHALFVFKGDAAEKVAHFVPRQEVIVSFSIRGYKYERDGKTRLFQKLEAWDIMSPKDRTMSEKWMAAKHWDEVSKMKPGEPDSSMKLSEEEALKRRPAEREYDSKTFNNKLDYSDTTNKDEEEELPTTNLPQEDGLPF